MLKGAATRLRNAQAIAATTRTKRSSEPTLSCRFDFAGPPVERLGRDRREAIARHIARPSDLGVYRLLLALRERGELEPFIRRALEPLLRDQRHADTLIETLEAFFASNGNSTKAAERLHLHRNSLLYRLNQARDLLHQDLDDPETRLTLQLAIKGLRVLRLKEERPTYDR